MQKQIVVMGYEPSPDLKLEKARGLLAKSADEKSLAETFSLISNKTWWIADCMEDYKEGTSEFDETKRSMDAWFGLLKEAEEKILAILRVEGIMIPETGRIAVLIPFMRRNGFCNAGGWWLPISN